MGGCDGRVELHVSLQIELLCEELAVPQGFGLAGEVLCPVPLI